MLFAKYNTINVTVLQQQITFKPWFTQCSDNINYHDKYSHNMLWYAFQYKLPNAGYGDCSIRVSELYLFDCIINLEIVSIK